MSTNTKSEREIKIDELNRLFVEIGQRYKRMRDYIIKNRQQTTLLDEFDMVFPTIHMDCKIDAGNMEDLQLRSFICDFIRQNESFEEILLHHGETSLVAINKEQRQKMYKCFHIYEEELHKYDTLILYGIVAVFSAALVIGMLIR